jgi:hypothetical protein
VEIHGDAPHEEGIAVRAGTQATLPILKALRQSFSRAAINCGSRRGWADRSCPK